MTPLYPARHRADRKRGSGRAKYLSSALPVVSQRYHCAGITAFDCHK